MPCRLAENCLSSNACRTSSDRSTRAALDLHLAGHDAGDVEEPVQELGLLSHDALDRLERLLGLLGLELSRSQETAPAEDRLERGAQLVRERRQELVLHVIGGVGGSLRSFGLGAKARLLGLVLLQQGDVVHREADADDGAARPADRKERRDEVASLGCEARIVDQDVESDRGFAAERTAQDLDDAVGDPGSHVADAPAEVLAYGNPVHPRERFVDLEITQVRVEEADADVRRVENRLESFALDRDGVVKLVALGLDPRPLAQQDREGQAREGEGQRGRIREVPRRLLGREGTDDDERTRVASTPARNPPANAQPAMTASNSGYAK